jgi:hypothetical protein
MHATPDGTHLRLVKTIKVSGRMYGEHLNWPLKGHSHCHTEEDDRHDEGDTGDCTARELLDAKERCAANDPDEHAIVDLIEDLHVPAGCRSGKFAATSW